jgi:hypothetical protein
MEHFMKRLWPLLALFLFQSCEYATLKYGYYWNPVTILSKAQEAIENRDLGQWQEVLSGKTLCAYGSHEGMANIGQAIKRIDQASIQEPLLVTSKHLERPNYIGYYSYYQETHISRAYDHQGRELLKVTIVCDFGSDELSKALVKAPVSSYKTKSCSITGIKNLEKPLKVPEFCSI